MSIKPKKSLIKEYAINPKDTGSPEVQVALLTHRILSVSDHLKKNPKDKHSQRGLMLMVGRRRRLLDYLKNQFHSRYEAVIKSLGLRR